MGAAAEAGEGCGADSRVGGGRSRLDIVKVVMLGAAGVGKTAIVQQFMFNSFSPEYQPTDRKQTYHPTVMINDHLYDLNIADLPVIPFFPESNAVEWSEFRFYGLRSATAYVLVFDLANAETFQYIRKIRDQMLASRDLRSVPVIVVGNKRDLLVFPPPASTAGSGTTGTGQSGASGGGPVVANNIGDRAHHHPSHHHPSHHHAHHQHHHHTHHQHLHHHHHHHHHTAEYREKRRDIVSLVKKHWKCGYVECSAKYNWRIVAVFHELMRSIDSTERTALSKEVAGSAPIVQDNKCVIL